MDKKVANDCELKWGLEPRDETIVMLRRPSSDGSYGEVLVVQPDDAAYTSDLFDLNRHDSSLRASWDRIVERTRSSAVGLWIPGKAVGFAVVQDGIASVFSVAVRMNDRRRGLATGIMNASATWAVEEGAEWQFVQVLGTNRVAIELYERLGFGERYRYHYLQAPGGR
jgi:ribosomal protein S18 acetylase RimI-like enzyme